MPAIRNNLMIMTTCWLCCAFDFYLLNFLIKYFPGNIYVNQVVKVLSELAGFITAGFIFQSFGVKRSLQFAFGTSFVGGLGILLFCTITGFYKNSKQIENHWVFPVLVLVTMYGISGAFSIVYLSNA